VALGIYKEGAAARFRERVHSGESRVQLEALATPDFREGTDLSDSLCLAVGSLCQRIALRQRRSPGEPA
jgi:hypothetical protein